MGRPDREWDESDPHLPPTSAADLATAERQARMDARAATEHLWHDDRPTAREIAEEEGWR